MVMPMGPSSPQHFLFSRTLVITRPPPAVSAQVTGGSAPQAYRSSLSSVISWLTRPSRGLGQLPQCCRGAALALAASIFRAWVSASFRVKSPPNRRYCFTPDPARRR